MAIALEIVATSRDSPLQNRYSTPSRFGRGLLLVCLDSVPMSLLTPLPFERPIHDLERQLETLEGQPNPSDTTKDAVRKMRVEIQRLKREVYDNLNPWETVQVSRHEARPNRDDRSSGADLADRGSSRGGRACGFREGTRAG